MRPHGPWQIVATREIYRDPWIRVQKDDVIRPDGLPGIHSVIHIKTGATVLAIDDQDHVYLSEEFHYGVGRITLEGVSGGSEKGEIPLETAKRELREELGFEAANWTDLGVVDPFTSNVVSPTRLYLARDLKKVASNPEGTEQIRCVRMPFAEALSKVMRSEITHAPTCVAILKAQYSQSDSRR